MAPPDELLSRLHGVTGPELTPIEPTSLVAWWCAIALVILSFAGIAILWPRRGAGLFSPAPEDVLTALRKLSPEPSADVLTAFESIIRQHLSQIYEVDAQRLTTTELIKVLPQAARSSWSDVLSPSERARFSGILPTQAAYSDLLQRAMTLIQIETKK